MAEEHLQSVAIVGELARYRGFIILQHQRVVGMYDLCTNSYQVCFLLFLINFCEAEEKNLCIFQVDWGLFESTTFWVTCFPIALMVA